MERLVCWYRQVSEAVPPEVLSAWLHHRFVHIHPFEDGNGRVARALASLVFLKVGLFPLVIRESDRIQYVDALESADKDNLKPMVTLFANRQRDTILKAIGLEQPILQPDQYQEARKESIAGKLRVAEQDRSVRGVCKNSVYQEQLHSSLNARPDQLQEVYAKAARLLEITQSRLTELQRDLCTELDTSFWVLSDSSTSHVEPDLPNLYLRIIRIARKFDCFTTLDQPITWARLSIRNKVANELVIGLHGYGHVPNGIMVGTALTAQRVPREEGGTEPACIDPAMTSFFQFNYAEPVESTEKRFKEWLESVIAIALEQWRRTINT